ncbi:MAG: hypothetical protein CM15mP29_0060 [Alphaproteobacteria bacterium]|nr:MAG: hypothetical protein CM15mP29_0060 [Alphaproteobacteria bacterium]
MELELSNASRAFSSEEKGINNMSAFLVHNNYIYYPHKKYLTHCQKHPLAFDISKIFREIIEKSLVSSVL